MKLKKAPPTCDICGLEFTTGFMVRGIDYSHSPTPFRKIWRVKGRRKDTRVCTKCMDILGGLIRNYRRERLEA